MILSILLLLIPQRVYLCTDPGNIVIIGATADCPRPEKNAKDFYAQGNQGIYKAEGYTRKQIANEMRATIKNRKCGWYLLEREVQDSPTPPDDIKQGD